MTATTDVLIAGAGPTGLLLAGDLAAAGVSCTLLERRDRTSNLTRAFAVHARTLELLDARGLADELVATGPREGHLTLWGRARVPLAGLPTRFPYVLVTPQHQTERVLERRATSLGAEIVRGAEVVAVRQDVTGVDVDVAGPEGMETRRAAYVVGSDGVHSAVRRALGLPFPGRSAIQSVMLADVRLTEVPAEPLAVDAVGEGFALIAPFGDGWYRVIAWDRRREAPDDVPVDLEELREITRLALGSDYGMHDPRWLSRFQSDERQVPRYRLGRVLLAGDAAHAHSPAGGQGMNTGLQDAANLGWKLAAELQGHAPPWLLDSYEAERRPVGRAVLRGSASLLRAAMLRSRALRAARNGLLRSAMRVPPLVRRAAGMISGIDIAYRAPRGAHPWTGRRVPDVGIVGESRPQRLYEVLRTGQFVLLERSADVRSTPAGGSAEDVERAVTGDAVPSLTLVRPDAYVAWATDRPAGSVRDAELMAALRHWGAARPTTRRAAAAPRAALPAS